MKYTIDYFIEKFSKIPESKWLENGRLIDRATGQACAYGHCGEGGCHTHEGAALSILFEDFTGNGTVANINDGRNISYQQPTPKQRILAALYDIKKMQEPKYEDLTKELAVLPADKIETDIINVKTPQL